MAKDISESAFNLDFGEKDSAPCDEDVVKSYETGDLMPLCRYLYHIVVPILRKKLFTDFEETSVSQKMAILNTALLYIVENNLINNFVDTKKIRRERNQPSSLKSHLLWCFMNTKFRKNLEDISDGKKFISESGNFKGGSVKNEAMNSKDRSLYDAWYLISEDDAKKEIFNEQMLDFDYDLEDNIEICARKLLEKIGEIGCKICIQCAVSIRLHKNSKQLERMNKTQFDLLGNLEIIFLKRSPVVDFESASEQLKMKSRAVMYELEKIKYSYFKTIEKFDEKECSLFRNKFVTMLLAKSGGIQ